MPGEEEIQQLCKEELDQFIDDKGYEDVEIGTEVSIIKDCTFVFEEQTKLYLGHAKTDVCIYLESESLSDHLQETSFFKLYQNGDKQIRLPLLIIETKRGDSDGKITTDAIRSRTIIAREINEIFPFCSYLFLADRARAVSPGKIHRAGKHYESFFAKDDRIDAEWFRSNVINSEIEPHLDKLSQEGIFR